MAKLLEMKAVDYILEEERDAAQETQTVFQLQPLSMKQRMHLKDNNVSMETSSLGPKDVGNSVIGMKLGTQDFLAIQMGLKAVFNLKDHKDEDVKYDSTTPTSKKQEVIGAFPDRWIKELAEKIAEISGVTKAEEKN